LLYTHYSGDPPRPAPQRHRGWLSPPASRLSTLVLTRPLANGAQLSVHTRDASTAVAASAARCPGGPPAGLLRAASALSNHKRGRKPLCKKAIRVFAPLREWRARPSNPRVLICVICFLSF
jgi:hypothetical protein